jgi:hypothetical protein
MDPLNQFAEFFQIDLMYLVPFAAWHVYAGGLGIAIVAFRQALRWNKSVERRQRSDSWLLVLLGVAIILGLLAIMPVTTVLLFVSLMCRQSECHLGL